MKAPELKLEHLRAAERVQDLVLTLDGRIAPEAPLPSAKAPATTPKPIERPSETWD